MSFSKLVKSYIDVNADGWVRKVAGPTAIGLSLGLSMAGCGGNEAEGIDNTAKGDQVKYCMTEKDCGLDMTCEIKNRCPEGALCILAPSGTCVPKARECVQNKDCHPGEHCEGASNICPEGAYCILPPTPGKCVANKECSVEKDCAKDQVCATFDMSGCPEGALCILPPDPKGVCENVCKTGADCAPGEQCVKEMPKAGGCPEGALCVLPPMPETGVCEIRILAILPPNW